MSAEIPSSTASGNAAAPASQDSHPVRIHTGNLKSSYCNTCSANTTREEVVLNFGINQNWDRGPDHHEVSLEHRVILSPFAAKRLLLLLDKLVTDYEARYGVLG